MDFWHVFLGVAVLLLLIVALMQWVIIRGLQSRVDDWRSVVHAQQVAMERRSTPNPEDED